MNEFMLVVYGDAETFISFTVNTFLNRDVIQASTNVCIYFDVGYIRE